LSFFRPNFTARVTKRALSDADVLAARQGTKRGIAAKDFSRKQAGKKNDERSNK
jgi:hypothetical protein